MPKVTNMARCASKYMRQAHKSSGSGPRTLTRKPHNCQNAALGTL